MVLSSQTRMSFTPFELAKLAIWYDAEKSVVSAQRKFSSTIDRHRCPSKNVIVSAHERLLRTGSVLPTPGKPSTDVPPQRVVRTTSTEKRVLEAFARSPEKSVRRGADELGLSKSTVHRILSENKLKPYKIQILQALNDEDIDRRMEFSEQMLNRMNEDEDLLDRVMFTDEAIFTLNGGVNKQNVRYWSDENPHFYTEQALHAPKIVVWCGLWSRGIVGPFFFEGTVNGENYLDMLKEWLIPQIQAHPLFDTMLFMQDGAPPHFSREVRAWLHDTFPERWIGRRGPIEWPPRSPDLTPLDFFLWGYLKSVVYAQKPKTIPELKAEITQACRRLPHSAIDRSLVAFKTRLQECVEQEGGHVELFT